MWRQDKADKVDSMMKEQIQHWAKSLLHFHPLSKVVLFSSSRTLLDLALDGTTVIIIDEASWESIFEGTPPEIVTVGRMAAKPPEFSDAVRLALLYRFGGSWLDVDDLAVRSFSSNPNMLCAMSWPGKRTVEYFGLSFELARGELISSHYRDSGIHIQNDPMLNWEPGNSFLKRWMTELLSSSLRRPSIGAKRFRRVFFFITRTLW